MHGVNEKGEEVVEEFGYYNLINLEAKGIEGISRIMDNIYERFN